MPPKDSKTASADEQAAVLEYMQTQNRPFSVQNIVDALQKHSIKKTAVDRSLASLLDAASITQKLYGKSAVYLVAQPPPPDASAHAETAALDAQIA
eukprot:CAMPEP_0184730824 /NCGR_PEP_ID=MMETSP0314-20130426/48815_1 /TAXON_ID=38298 /ORGANISM="Rhodella maculata, Strain CCMP 736" /LENGTH=95 /DNA_ID=CAMNT_0027197077 /DNA_START=102 /DNA_END=386 /DNA_ORIENTATION=-